MLNHTYTSVNNANLVDCGKKQHIPSQPSALLRDNFLGEYRTELDKKKVLANLGIVTDLLLEWEYIKGDIGKNATLMQELDSRTKYISEIDGFQKTLADGLRYLETVIGSEEEKESIQDERLSVLETSTESLLTSLNDVKTYLETSVDVSIDKLETDLATITEKVNNITELIQVSNKEGNALRLLSQEELKEGETVGLYVPDLSQEVSESSAKIIELQDSVGSIQESLDTFVTKEELGGGDFDFVDQDDFDNYTDITDEKISEIQEELKNTVKTGEDGHVDTLYVNTISKNNDDSNIKITDSFDVQSGIPLDIRFVKENLEELCSIPVAVCYPGMGVIVNSLSALYILRKPENDAPLTQEYVSNSNNWKCPEDLVTVALTREEYENLEEINPYVFYYVYEDEITRTQEPKRSEYASDEEFALAWEQWVNSLKTLSQEYMSASWGVDIETKLGKKASTESLNKVLDEIAKIKGNGDGPSLDSLSASIEELQQQDVAIKTVVDEILIKSEGADSGRLVDAEKSISDITNSLSNYVTKEDLYDSDNDFIFLNKDDYQEDQDLFKQQLAAEITTQSLETEQVKLNGATLTVTDDRLNYSNKQVAHVDELPQLQVLSEEEYNKLEEINEDTYYYTYDNAESLATKSDISTAIASVTQQLESVSSTMVSKEVYDTLVARVAALEAFIETLKPQN